jgi:predicted TIM-barrel fold metal-dependent hydrolase
MTVCISADSHVTEPAGTYVDRVPAKWRDRAPQLRFDDNLGDVMVIDNGQFVVPYSIIAAAGLPSEEVRLDTGRTFDQLHRGGWDPAARLDDQDRDSVAAEVIYPSVGMLLCNHPEPEYQRVCFEAYNEWLAEFCAHDPQRLVGVGQTAMRTPEEGIADLERIKELGLRGVMLPGRPPEQDYDHPMYDALWEAVVDMELPPSFHILTGGESDLWGRIRGPRLNGFLRVIRGNQDIIGMLTFGAVFDRHPNLRIVCVEADAGWLPHFLYRADHGYERHRHWLPAGALSKRPSEYMLDQVYMTFQDDWVAFRMTDLVNVDRLMWANDFPHSDATWPNSQAMLAEQTQHLSPHARERILHGNVAELYGITV